MYGTHPALVRLPFSIHLIVEVALEADQDVAQTGILKMFQSTLSWK